MKCGEAERDFSRAANPSHSHPVIPQRVAPQWSPSPFHRIATRMADLPSFIKMQGVGAYRLKKSFRGLPESDFVEPSGIEVPP